jgi:hypothetical protein
MELVLLFVTQPGRLPLAAQDAEELAKLADELRARGALRLAAAPLRPEAEAARVCVRDGAARVVAGPFVEAPEVLAGCLALDVADREAALAVAERCPSARAGAVEVRPGRVRCGRASSGAKRFLLLYLLERGAPVPDEARIRQGMAEMRAFTSELERQGRYLGDGALPPQLPAVRVSVRRGRRAVLDGPFAESKEVVAGFALLEAASREDAIEIAKTVPHAAWGAIEVRELAQPR